jgi:YesN/AraC family two-component response regulator
MQHLNSVLKYIEQHLHENITIQQLADIVHFHPNYLIRQFHERVGSSPIQYIQRLKMDAAKTWLTATDDAISDIAGKVGMELYYFSRIFKKQTGLSPTEYRQMMSRS